MNDMESRKFEDAFKSAFDEAEVSPSEAVWTNIELDLEREDKGKMKRRLLFYQLLAAASVAFAMTVAGIHYYSGDALPGNNTHEALALGQTKDSETLASNQTQTDTKELSSEQASNAEEQNGTTNASTSNGDALTNNSVASQSQENTVAQRNKDQKDPSNASADYADARTSNDAALAQLNESSSTNGKQNNKAKQAGNNQNNNQSAIAYTNTSKGDKEPATVVSEKTATGGRESITSADKVQANEGIVTSENAAVVASGEKNTRTNSPVNRATTVEGQPGDVQSVSNANTGTVVSGSANPFALALAGNTVQDVWKNQSARQVNPLPSKVTPAVPLDAEMLKPQEDPLLALLARLDQEGKTVVEKSSSKENADEKLWTSVGFAAGGFSTVNSTVSQSASSMSFNNIATQQAKSSGVAYTVGVSMGTRVAERWVVQGGVNYLSQASDYTSSAVGVNDQNKQFSAPSMNNIQAADTRLVPSASYNIDNQVRYISIPLQAGYLVVNRKFGIQLNGGLSTDLFLQNTITPESESLEQVTQTRGEASPYRSVNFSGLVGTEFSYRIGQHYRLALNPGLRYPLNSIYKSDQPVEAMPLTFDLGLRFRYIFH